MHAQQPTDTRRRSAAPSVWDEFGGPDGGAAAATAPAKRARWRRKQGKGAADALSPGLAAALNHLESTRGAVEAGPDMGDLLLDFLQVCWTSRLGDPDEPTSDQNLGCFAGPLPTLCK